MKGMEESGNELVQQIRGNPFLPRSKQQQYSNNGAKAGKFLFPAPRLPPMAHQLPPPGPLHSRSRSQPAVFSLDSLQPPGHNVDSSPTADVSMDEHHVRSSHSPPLPPCNVAASCAADLASVKEGLPPRKAHRRSQSDVPFAFLSPCLPVQAEDAAPLAAGFLDSAKPTAAAVKVEIDWNRGLDVAGVTGDDLFNAYMNLDGLDALNSSQDNREDFDSRDSGSKTNAADSSENEADSNVKERAGGSCSVGLRANDASRKEGLKRNAAGDPTPVMAASRHSRSLSMDSFAGKFNFEEEPPKPLPFPGARAGHAAPNTFSLEFGNGQFSGVEMKKIMENEKLAEMARTDPKRVKRILANRQSAARSKERKTRYIAELEHKVRALQTETTTLSTQLTSLQRDSAGLTNRNTELKFRLQAMERQAQLRDALNEALTAEVQHLKLAAAGLTDAHSSNSLNPRETSMNPPHICLLQQQYPTPETTDRGSHGFQFRSIT